MISFGGTAPEMAAGMDALHRLWLKLFDCPGVVQ
jgi:hypothetical protein